MIKRSSEENVKKDLFRGKSIVLYGARQIGKTTSLKNILAEFGEKGRYLDCELLTITERFNDLEPENLRTFLGDYKVVGLDEAQNLKAPGKLLKILTDHLPEIQIIATGSSSFELAEKISEPMTGRIFQHEMYPLSVGEIKAIGDWFDIESKLDKMLRFGNYPEVFLSAETDAARILDQIASSYLYKDILKFQEIRKPEIVKNLLILIALQTGSEVSYSELATKLGVDMRTVQSYIDILEKSFVLFRLHSFSRNLRNELTKAVKIYFYDTGIRNSLINNFNLLAMRNDTGALWENFLIAERVKKNAYERKRVNSYFWRTYQQKEVDYIEEEGGVIRGFEFSYSSKKIGNKLKQFKESYNAEIELITRKNYWKFLG